MNKVIADYTVLATNNSIITYGSIRLPSTAMAESYKQELKSTFELSFPGCVVKMNKYVLSEEFEA